ncbi:MAG: 4-alpha-glucanotransferase [Succiniclasticum sp.]|jgi:4-alpha-glucanotransferase
MAYTLFHDSRNPDFRIPFGAVPTGTVVTLRLHVAWDAPEKPLKDSSKDAGKGARKGASKGAAAPAPKTADASGGPDEVLLRLWQNDQERRIPMTRVSPEAPDRHDALYEASIRTPGQGCLVWYYFVARKGQDICYYGTNEGEDGGSGRQTAKEPPSFQITVYDRDAVTPEWLKKAVIYQIFPDRFARGTVPDGRFAGKHAAVLHSNWYDDPMYVKNEDGSIKYFDFFGGTLEGIREQLGYLADLGVTCLYLNPVFAARSNHRYDTACYKKVDPFLGGETALRELCAAAKEKGMRVLLDGVFSHTGADSIYFNRFGTYDNVGAYQSKKSPYASWYQFRKFPNDYACWWGDQSLPEVDETNLSYLRYMLYDEDSVIRHWQRAGISGWRLDVADELPDGFLVPFYAAVKALDPENAVIGEVWEDASHKESYGVQRQYLSGGKLDSVMNYVLRNIQLDFVLGKADAAATDRAYAQQRENYPPQALYAAMNLLGSHDVERLRTVLADGVSIPAVRPLEVLLRTWQMTLPGAPAVYYGDEAGLTGRKDPENRKTFPWGREDKVLQDCVRQLIHLRRRHDALSTGRFDTLAAAGDVYIYARFVEGGRDVFGQAATDGVYVIALNRSDEARTQAVDSRGLVWGTLVPLWDSARVLAGTPVAPVATRDGKFTVTLPPWSAVVFQCQEAGTPEGTGPAPARAAGILLHPTSLPGRTGQEQFQAALDFVDFLADAGQSVWQILPLNPPGLGDSPYLSVSAFAGSETLFAGGDDEDVPAAAFRTFCERQSYWLDDYALFRALKERYGGRPWQTWPEPVRQRDPVVLAQLRQDLAPAVTVWKKRQFRFRQKWDQIHAAAHRKGIRILGDLPLFVAPDSADCWAHPELFTLDKDGQPTAIAGVPPDYFSEYGQVWGNPQYRWEAHARECWRWWKERFRALAGLVDMVRLDHFRGLAATWWIDGKDRDARKGQWVPAPGRKVLEAVRAAVPSLALVAEDLGVITDDVIDLRQHFGLPGMRVLEFHLTTRSDGQTSFDTEPNCVAYTGTHDNNTLAGWLAGDIDDSMRRRLTDLAASFPEDTLPQRLVHYLYTRRAALVVTPLQDLLDLPSADRMNTPGTATGNWQWKLPGRTLAGALPRNLAARLHSLAEETGRIPHQPTEK